MSFGYYYLTPLEPQTPLDERSFYHRDFLYNGLPQIERLSYLEISKPFMGISQQPGGMSYMNILNKGTLDDKRN